MNKKLVSVIVPVYNVSKYMLPCVKSILKQSYTNIELILVDDGSVDKSGSICDEFAIMDKRVKAFHQKNSGVSIARNVGLDNAVGDYIVFVDGDDIIEDNMIEILINDLNIYNVDVACSFCFTYKRWFLNNKDKTDVFCTEDALKHFLLGNICYGNVAKLFSRRIIGDIRFEKNITHGEDFLFNWLVFRKANKISLNSKGLYHCIYRDESASHKFTEKRFTEIDSRKIVCDGVKKEYPKISDYAELHYSRMLVSIANNICSNGKCAEHKQYDRIKNYLIGNRKRYVNNVLASKSEVIKSSMYLRRFTILVFIYKVYYNPKQKLKNGIKKVLSIIIGKGVE